MREKVEEKIERIYKELDEIHYQVWTLSQFVKILMLGHQTKRKHKNIFKRMFNKLQKFSKEKPSHKQEEENKK